MTSFSLLITATLFAVNVHSSEPWFCHDQNCPPFQNLKNITENGQVIDMRKYKSQLWASTNITDERYTIHNTIY